MSSPAARKGPDPARLLVVDDEAMLLELLSGSLRFAGFEVVTAASGVRRARGVRKLRLTGRRTGLRCRYLRSDLKLARVSAEELRLLPGGEVATPVELVEVDLRHELRQAV